MFKSVIFEIFPTIINRTINKTIINSQKIKLKCSKNILGSTSSSIAVQTSNFSTTNKYYGLEEFFDKEENWGAAKVKHGREWRMEDLRVKSNVDLHKLWFVLLKERNMLLTMEEACKKNYEPMPSPERLAKVDLSLENILATVKERNVAYNILETGESKDLVPYYRFNSFGYLIKHKPKEYYLPWYMNTTWRLKNHSKHLPFWSKWYRTVLMNKYERSRKQQEKLALKKLEKLKEEFPDMVDEEYVKEYLRKKYVTKQPYDINEKLLKPNKKETIETIALKEKKNDGIELLEDKF